MPRRLTRTTLLMASAMTLTALGAGSAHADADGQLGTIEKQIRALQAELHRMKAETAQRDRELRAARSQAYAPPPPANQPMGLTPQIPAGYALVPSVPGTAGGSLSLVRIEQPRKIPKGSFDVGAVNVQLGGFFEAAGYARSRNEVTDLSSSFNGAIPLRNSPLYHEAQSGFSARQSRFTVMATAEPDEATKLSAYLAVDFLGAAPTANYNESSSFTPRIREGWVEYARKDYGFYVLGGQSWSLATMNTKGVDPTAINLPLQIDPQYVVGLNWARQAQFRIAKNLGSDQFWAALSVENASTILGGTLPTAGNPGFETGSVINATNSGTGVNATGNVFTNNFSPDVIFKTTADFNIAHLEAFGLGRVFNDRISHVGGGTNHAQIGGGAGGGMIIHVIPKLLDIQFSGLAGEGVSRYGTSQLTDATYNYQGQEAPLPGYSALAGVVAHPDKANDLYAYFGVEHVSAHYDTGLVKGKQVTLAGYGSDLINNISCSTELATEPAPCTAASSGDAQITVGNWYKFIQGPYGKMQIGAQYSYTRRFLLQGIGQTPKTDENMLFLSFRWYPFT